MKNIVIAAVVLAIGVGAGAACAQATLTPLPQAPTVSPQLGPNDPYRATMGGFVNKAFGPISIMRSALGAGTEQGLDHPKEWGQGWAAYGERFASSMGTRFVESSVKYSFGAALHEEVHYRPSQGTGFKSKLGYALMSTFITHNTDSGNRTFAFGEVGGAFAGGFVSRTWQPASSRGWGHGMESAGLILAIDAGTNVAKEFFPGLLHVKRHQASAYHTSPTP